MKLAFTTLFVAGIELALFANVGCAYSAFSSGAVAALAARNAGYDLTDSVFARSAYAPELSDISTRALLGELQDRLVRRDGDHDRIKAIRKLLKTAKGADHDKLLGELKGLLKKTKKTGAGHKNSDAAPAPVPPVSDDTTTHQTPGTGPPAPVDAVKADANTPAVVPPATPATPATTV